MPDAREIARERCRVQSVCWIWRFPGMVAQLGEVVAAGGDREHGERFSLASHPVVGVRWYEALAFTRWPTRRLREAGLPEGWVVALPSEVEWKMAARGGRVLPAGGRPSSPWSRCWGVGAGRRGGAGR